MIYRNLITFNETIEESGVPESPGLPLGPGGHRMQGKGSLLNCPGLAVHAGPLTPAWPGLPFSPSLPGSPTGPENSTPLAMPASSSAVNAFLMDQAMVS
uniref:Uncharacterized protein n=1 Tax=Romanomermis culicivorax TaxID=13658 RepID=A0A915JMN7_ROMCU